MINLTKIIAAILVLLALALGGYAWVLGRTPAPPAPARPAATSQGQIDGPSHRVVVTTKAVPAGQPIAADAVRLVQLPIDPAGALRDTTAAAGRVPVVDLGEGTPLLENQLVSGLALRIGEGERAIAIKADEVMGVGNRIRPGDFVDVFFVLKSDGKEIDRSQVRLLLARKRVLTYGSASVDGQSATGANGASGNGTPPQPARTAVLAVPVDEVNRLALGDHHGRLLLALRHPGDTAEPDPALFAALPTALQPAPAKPGARDTPLPGLDQARAGLTVADLASGGRAASLPATARATPVRPVPAAAPRAAGTEIEVIRGDRREMLQY